MSRAEPLILNKPNEAENSCEGDRLVFKSTTFTREGKAVLGPLNLRVGAGQRWVVLGPNGSGKTTMLRLACALVRPSAGELWVLGNQIGRTDLRILRRRIGMSSAAIRSQIAGYLPAAEVVLTGIGSALAPWWSTYSEAERSLARSLLEMSGLGVKEEQPWDTLSEGERQQVLLCRALIDEPELLLLDEPFAALDLGARERLMMRLSGLVERHPQLPVMLVTHHVEEIPPSFTHCLLMSGGKAVACGPIDEVLNASNLSACFGLELKIERLERRWRASSSF